MRRYAVFVLLGMLCLRFFYWKGQQQIARNTEALIRSDNAERLGFLVFRGDPAALPGGKWRLYGAEVWDRGQWVRFSGILVFSENQSGLNFEHKVAVFGNFSGPASYLNPGWAEDGMESLMPVRIRGPKASGGLKVLPQPLSFGVRTQRKAVHFFQRHLAAFPGLYALGCAVWFGSTELLPESIQQFYLQGGLMPVLALSGQHVAVLFLLVQGLLQGGLRAAPGILRFSIPRLVLREAQKALPLLCASVLYLTSLGGAPIQRTWVMACTLYGLRSLRLHTSTAQWVASSVAALLIWNPSLLTRPSFFLSAMATLFMAAVFSAGRFKERFCRYLAVCLAMPFLVAPLNAFLFAKVTWAAPLLNLLLCGFWDLVWIPLGFLLPALILALPLAAQTWLFYQLERGWGFFLDAHGPAQHWVEKGYQSVVRPTWFEFLFLEFLFCTLGVLAFRWARSRRAV